MRLASLAAAFALAVMQPALAQSSLMDVSTVRGIDEEKVFVFGGRMAESHMWQMTIPFTVTYEDAFIIGAGYQRFFGEWNDFKLGLEVGAAGRFGEIATAEMWAGAVGRYDGFVIADRYRVSPALTFGLSMVSDTMGIEAYREAQSGLPGDLLFYLSPEISVSTLDNPNSELFWRIHHRSSAWHSFGGGGSANVTTVGLRQTF